MGRKGGKKTLGTKKMQRARRFCVLDKIAHNARKIEDIGTSNMERRAGLAESFSSSKTKLGILARKPPLPFLHLHLCYLASINNSSNTQAAINTNSAPQ